MLFFYTVKCSFELFDFVRSCSRVDDDLRGSATAPIQTRSVGTNHLLAQHHCAIERVLRIDSAIHVLKADEGLSFHISFLRDHIENAAKVAEGEVETITQSVLVDLVVEISHVESAEQRMSGCGFRGAKHRSTTYVCVSARSLGMACGPLRGAMMDAARDHR